LIDGLPAYNGGGGLIMKTLKLNFTIPEDVAEALKARVSRRKRSAFVAAAVADKLKDLEKEQLRQSMVEGYQERQAEDSEVNRDWERATIEEWPR
jgi:hypothetical protein